MSQGPSHIIHSRFSLSKESGRAAAAAVSMEALAAATSPSPTLSPPPAYAPISQDDDRILQAIRAAAISNYSSSTATDIRDPVERGLTRAVTAMDMDSETDSSELGRGDDDTMYAADEEEGDEEGALSPIVVRIDTGVRVSSDDNIVVLSSDPTDNANAIAAAVLAAIRQASSANVGVPMVDENGVPRPLRIEVKADIGVRGRRNVLGPEDFVREYVAATTTVDHRRQHNSPAAAAAASASDAGRQDGQQRPSSSAARKRGRESAAGVSGGADEGDDGEEISPSASKRRSVDASATTRT